MGAIERYLDLDLIINGTMDAFLLVLTGRILRFPIRVKQIGAGTLLGAIPVLLTYFPALPGSFLSRILIPFLMVGAAFWQQGVRGMMRALVGFWLLSAGLGGFIYALWGWTRWSNTWAGDTLQLALSNLWILPLAGGLWWAGQKLMESWQSRSALLKQVTYDLEIDLGKEDSLIKVRALMDTGNQLCDPITRKPVILLEEAMAQEALPTEIKEFLELPWREEPDPWPLLWKENPAVMSKIVFIPMQTVERQSWVVGIRPKSVRVLGETIREVGATVALVPQTLSRQGEYKALLHPDLRFEIQV